MSSRGTLADPIVVGDSDDLEGSSNFWRTPGLTEPSPRRPRAAVSDQGSVIEPEPPARGTISCPPNGPSPLRQNSTPLRKIGSQPSRRVHNVAFRSPEAAASSLIEDRHARRHDAENRREGPQAFEASPSTPSISRSDGQSGATPKRATSSHYGNSGSSDEEKVQIAGQTQRGIEHETDALPRQGMPRAGSPVSSGTSINPSSPLVHQLQERRARLQSGHAGTQADSSISKLKPTSASALNSSYTVSQLQDAFRRFKKDMEDQHRLTVRWLLHDAHQAYKSPLPLDKVCPFAHMKSVQLLTGEAPPGRSILEVESYFNSSTKKKPSKTRSVFLTNSTHSDVKRVPSYSHYTAVKRNILVPDSEELKYIPFVNNTDDRNREKQTAVAVKELQDAHERVPDGPFQKEAPRLLVHIEEWLQNLNICCDIQSLRCYLLDTNTSNLSIRESDRQLLLTAFGSPLDANVTEMARRFSQAFGNVFGYPLTDVLLPKKYLKELARIERKKLADTVHRASDGMADIYGTYAMTCLICGVVCCPTHGEYKNPHEDSDGLEPYESTHELLSIPYDAAFRKHRERQSNKITRSVPADHPSCSTSCYRVETGEDAEPKQWAQSEMDEVRRMWRTLRDPTERSCSIAFILDLDCRQVYDLIEEFERESSPALAPLEAQQRRSKRPEWYDNKRKALLGNWTAATGAHLQHERTQANPCSHEGPCNDNECPCFKSNILCETICACPDDCLRRFTGCSCISSGMSCTTDSCICIQMNRECGPQCTSCGAIPRLNPAVRHDDNLFQMGCQNVVLQRGVSKKTIAGESQLEGVGFGLYTAEDIKKGEYIGEYAGEIISTAEAEKRGIIYNERNVSFLFDINADWVVDGARLGNGMRFINHADSAEYGLNCFARIMLVNGEHRIKFVAARDIEAGEELLFDYGKKFAREHKLEKRLEKVKDGRKGKGVSDEALKAADELDARRDAGRRKFTAVDGAHRKMAIKTASRDGHRSTMHKSASGNVSGSVSTPRKAVFAGGRQTARKSAPVRSERDRKRDKARERVELDAIAAPEDVPDIDESDDYVLTEGDDDEDDEDEDSDDDDEESPYRDPRMKRHIKRPSRYTR